MKEYRYTYSPDQTAIPAIDSDTLFIDIETTGFQRNSTFLTIIGLAFMEQDKLVIEQWFNEQGTLDEPVLLLQLEKRLRKRECLPRLIHYNGTTFDLPYLKAKYEQYHLPTSLSECDSLDLYRLAKTYKNLLSLDGFKQKNLEEAFGLYRNDTLSGQELIETYLDGIRFQDASLIDAYLLHNKEDMEGMVFLQNLIRLDDFFHGRFTIKEWKEQETKIVITLKNEIYLTNPLHFSFEGIHFTLDRGEATLEIPVYVMEARYFYENYKDYFYLPLEDRAIHKSVASYVEKEFREKAKKENCYIKKTAPFLPFPLPASAKKRKECLKEHCHFEFFYQEFGDCTAYISSVMENDEDRHKYLSHLLSAVL